jgi:hypothetical protein
MCDACGEEERAIDAALAKYEASRAKRALPPEDVWQRYLTAMESIDACEARIAALESQIRDLLAERRRDPWA